MLLHYKESGGGSISSPNRSVMSSRNTFLCIFLFLNMFNIYPSLMHNGGNMAAEVLGITMIHHQPKCQDIKKRH